MIILRKPGKNNYIDLLAYRPIILLNTLGKALELIIVRHLRFLSEKHTLLPDTQIGARG